MIDLTGNKLAIAPAFLHDAVRNMRAAGIDAKLMTRREGFEAVLRTIDPAHHAELRALFEAVEIERAIERSR